MHAASMNTALDESICMIYRRVGLLLVSVQVFPCAICCPALLACVHDWSAWHPWFSASHPLLVTPEIEPSPSALLLLPLLRLLALPVALLALAPLLLEALLLHAPLLELGGLHRPVVHDVEGVLLRSNTHAPMQLCWMQRCERSHAAF